MNLTELILKWEQKKVTAKMKRFDFHKRNNHHLAAEQNWKARAISAILKDLKNLPNEPKTVSNNEQNLKLCFYGNVHCRNYNLSYRGCNECNVSMAK